MVDLKLFWRAADESIGGESLGAEEVPLIDTGLPKPEDYEMELGRTPSFKKRKRSKLGLLPLVALIFYEVSGGPFGTEVRPLTSTHGFQDLLSSTKQRGMHAINTFWSGGHVMRK